MNKYQTHYSLRKSLQERVIQNRFFSLILSPNCTIKSNHGKAYKNVLAVSNEDQCCLLAGGSDGSIELFDLHLLNLEYKCSVVKPARRLVSHKGIVSSVQWFPTDNDVFITSGYDQMLKLYSTTTFTAVETFDVKSSIFKSKFHPNGTLIASGLASGTIVICDPDTGDLSHTLVGHNEAVTNLDWHPYNQYLLASCSRDGSVRVWDVRKGGRDALLVCLDWQRDHTAMAKPTFTKSKSSALTAFRGVPGSISKFAANSISHRSVNWSQVESCKAHSGAVHGVKFTPCGRYLITAGNDPAATSSASVPTVHSSSSSSSLSAGSPNKVGKVRLWNSSNGELQPTHYSCAYASNLPVDIELCSVNTADTHDDDSCYNGSSAPASRLLCRQKQFLGDTFMVTPHIYDGDIAVTPVYSTTGDPIILLSGHMDKVTSVVYRSATQQVISAAKDNLILVWSPKAPHPVEREDAVLTGKRRRVF